MLGIKAEALGLVAAIVGFILPSGASGQAAALDAQRCQETEDTIRAHFKIPERAVIPLDNLGVSGWRFRNPRRPVVLIVEENPPVRVPGETEPVFSARAAVHDRVVANCRDTAQNLLEVYFDNRALDRNFDVEFKFDLLIPGTASLERLEILEIASLRREVADLRREQALAARVREKLPDDIKDRMPSPRESASERELLQGFGEVKEYLTSLEGAQVVVENQENRLAGLEARRDELARRRRTGATERESAAINEEVASLQETIEGTRREIAAAGDLKKLEPEIDEAIARLSEPETEQDLDLDARVEAVLGVDADVDLTGASGLENAEDLLQDAQLEAAMAEDWTEVSDVPGGPAEGAEPEQVDPQRASEYQNVCNLAVQNLTRVLASTDSATGGKESENLAGDFERCVEKIVERFGSSRPFAEGAFGANAQRLEHFLRELADRQPPLRLTELCKVKSAEVLSCTFRLLVPANTSARVPPIVIATLPKGLVQFTVSFRGEDTAPLNSIGYLSTARNPGEPENRFAWTLTGRAGFAADPDPDSTPNVALTDPVTGNATCTNLADPACDTITPYSETDPYEGERRSRFNGSGVLQVATNLGNRARGQVDFTFKNGDLAAADREGQTKVQQYNFEIFSLNGLGLKLGKYTLANPASGLAVNEAGEGFELLYKWFSLGYISKRESLAFEATDRDEDGEVVVLQLRNLSTGNVDFIRGLSVLVLAGEDQNPTLAYEYWTAGAELYLAQPSSRLSGSLSYYASERKSKGPQAGQRGRGNVGLLTVGGWWPSRQDPLKVARKLDFRGGFGSGDDPNTGDHDEGYIGETSGTFTGGTFFLSNVTGLIADPVTGKKLRPGLSNKSFAGLVFTDRTLSPLIGIASLLQVGDKVINQSTVLRAHSFRFDEKVFGGREIGSEIGVDFTIEVPAGITSTLGFSYFLPGDALEKVLDREPWAITSSVTVKIF